MRYRRFLAMTAVVLMAACAGQLERSAVPDFETRLACESSSLTLEDAQAGRIPAWDDPRMQLIRRVARTSSDEEVKSIAETLVSAAKREREKRFLEAARSLAAGCKGYGWKPIGSAP